MYASTYLRNMLLTQYNTDNYNLTNVCSVKKMYIDKVAEQITTESKFWTGRKIHYNINVWETEKLKYVVEVGNNNTN